MPFVECTFPHVFEKKGDTFTVNKMFFYCLEYNFWINRVISASKAIFLIYAFGAVLFWTGK